MSMRLSGSIPFRRRRQLGSAAVELALVLPIIVMFMTFTVFFSSCMWHYTVVQKAAQDSARYLSQVPRAEMMSQSLTKAAAAVATRIVRLEIAELRPGSTINDPDILCESKSGTDSCGFTSGELPTAVSVSISIGMFDTFFGVVDTGRYGLKINAKARMAYVGN